MKCSYCKLRAVYFARHFGKAFCKKHLESYLLKKLRRRIRGEKIASPGDKLSIAEGTSPASAAASSLFRKAVEDWPVEFGERGKQIELDTLDFEVERIVEALARGDLYFPEKGAKKPFRDFVLKELFTLGWLEGHREREPKKLYLTASLGVAAKLNLLKVWDRIQESSKLQQSRKSREGDRKQGR